MTHEVNISTVRSVSGLAVDVLKLAPLLTVNHWPFLICDVIFNEMFFLIEKKKL